MTTDRQTEKQRLEAARDELAAFAADKGPIMQAICHSMGHQFAIDTHEDIVKAVVAETGLNPDEDFEELEWIEAAFSRIVRRRLGWDTP